LLSCNGNKCKQCLYEETGWREYRDEEIREEWGGEKTEKTEGRQERQGDRGDRETEIQKCHSRIKLFCTSIFFQSAKFLLMAFSHQPTFGQQLATTRLSTLQTFNCQKITAKKVLY
jgi:hypothetical protein